MKIKKIIKYPIIFLYTAIILVMLLIGSAFIPDDMIKDNMRSSADFLCEKIVFFDLIPEVPASKIDRYADSILLNIAYNYDIDDPLRSVMISEYYYTDYQNENDNFRDAVTEGLEPNTQYLRYWHGSALFVRIAHIFTNIRGMYIISTIAAVALYGVLGFILIKHRLYAGAIALGVSLITASVWFVPLSLEYTWVFLVAPAAAIAAVKLVLSGKWNAVGAVFLISGMVTNFLDFLTAETVTLLFPLLLTIYTAEKIKPAPTRPKALGTIKLCVLWGVGYVGMWVLKWLTAAVVLGEDVMPYISEHITERMVGTSFGAEGANVFAAIWRNISCLFPLCFGGVGTIASIVLFVAAVYVCVVYHRNGFSKANVVIYAAVGAIPLLRFAVLMNHAYIHYFFSYRALAGTILAIILIIFEMIGLGRAKHEARKRKRA